MLDLDAIRSSVASELRSRCADLAYRFCIDQGVGTANLQSILDDLMQRESTLEWIERLVAEQARQIH